MAAGLLGIGALVVLAYFRTSDEDPGATTEIAAFAAYLLGALAYSRPALAVGLAVVVALLLVSKTRIHRFAREIVSEVELEDAIKFFVVAFVVLPLLPDRQLGLRCAESGKAVVDRGAPDGDQLGGVHRRSGTGARAGLLVTGLAGGFVSAAATTASMGRLSRTAAGGGRRWQERYWQVSPLLCSCSS